MTIHANDVFAEALRGYAARLGKSVNQTVQDLLAPTLGLVSNSVVPENPFMACCGVIGRSDGESVKKSMLDHRKVDAEMWR